MAWETLVPTGKLSDKGNFPVRIKVSPPTRRGRASRLFISIRPDLMEGGLPFWSVGQAVHVMVGTGEHAGRLRIQPGNQFKIAAIGATGKQAASIVVPVPDVMDDAKRDRLCCEYDHNDAWLEIVIPALLLRGPAVPTGGWNKLPGAFQTAATRPNAPRPAVGGR